MCEDPGEAEKVGFSGSRNKANMAKIREKKERENLEHCLTH